MDLNQGQGQSFSINYSEQEYTSDVVSSMAEICRSESLPHPNITTESGRAITAHPAMLVFNMLETTTAGQRADGRIARGGKTRINL